MTYRIAAGIQISLDGTNWYKLSDHNRQQIGFSYDIIENSKRMANGLMRKYVVAKKLKISTSWNNLPTLDQNLVDYDPTTKGGAWMKAFYEANVFVPVQVRIIFAQETTPTNGSVPVDATYVDSVHNGGVAKNYYITSFTYDVLKRMVQSGSTSGIDYTDIKIEFTEI